MIRDQARLDTLLDDIRHWVREVAIPSEARVERLDEVLGRVEEIEKRRNVVR